MKNGTCDLTLLCAKAAKDKTNSRDAAAPATMAATGKVSPLPP
jgi:hypothetical protein